ncbi:hypothetical protein ASC97_17760 [Rhizobium sp. Root1203]|uniref:hypothetical protein n=1 Tax=Rhizobium sp. Root1203 TaxID=1736427 RepID=UPI00070E7964|nr:hypothetical protein [Rhizobium sp. Root1203]KQV31872.1 hypothetical protein ASC97_17760 [Rhizobium sp. Root1203]
MLTPVRAASNSSFSSQGQNTALGTDGVVRGATAVAPVNHIESPDLNSAIAAKLNILLLAVRARMVEALLDVINAAGDALSQPRDDDETEIAFASRLADAIQKLPASKIETIERQLAAQGHSVPLRLLAAALKNPAGPEAARIAAYLETVRYKDRDLAARAVVRSYGQNDASPSRQEQRPEISLHRDTLATAARAAPPATSHEDPADAPAGTANAVVATYLDAESAERSEVPIKMAADGREIAGDKTPAATTISRGAPTEAQKAEEPLLPPDDETAVATAEPAAGNAMNADAEPRVAKGDPIIPKSWAGIPASLSDDATGLIVSIIRDQEAEILLEAADVDPAVEIDVILDETLIGDIPEELRLTPDQAPRMNDPGRQPSLLASEPLIGPTSASVAANRHAAPEAEPPPVLQHTIDAAYAPVMMKIVEGVPYAIQPYQFAKDEAEDGGSREMHREDHDGGTPSEQQEADGQPDASEDAEPEVQAQGEASISSENADTRSETPLLPAPGFAMPPVAEEAYTLYRRMVGWE